MGELTISLNEALLAKARIEAGKEGKTLSQFVSQLLEQRVGPPLTQNEALELFLAGPPLTSSTRTGRHLRGTKCMSEHVFVDTNVFIYARDDRFPEKQARTRRITRRGMGVISPQIIGEIHSVASKGQLDSHQFRRPLLPV
jgi:hypothetical protein